MWELFFLSETLKEGYLRLNGYRGNVYLALLTSICQLHVNLLLRESWSLLWAMLCYQFKIAGH